MKKLDTEVRVAVLETDNLCLGCYGSDHEHSYPVYVEMGIEAGGKVYTHCSTLLCEICVRRQDYNLLKKRLKYFLMESIAYKLDA